jgi:hypothetical protein
MSKKTVRKNAGSNKARSVTSGSLPGKRRTVVVAIAVLLTLVAISGVTAHLQSPQKPGAKGASQPASPAPASLSPSSPSKEYIYAGGKLIATEERISSGCTFSIAPTSQSFPPSGGTGTVTVSTGSGCGWTATSTAWITITSGTPGTGPGSVNYSVLSNASPNPRNGTITIMDQTFNVSQAGTGSCGGPANGTGLKGDYFNNITLSGAPVLTRTDPVVDFQWVTGIPGSGVNPDQFSVRWTGQVQPQCTEAYTFYVLSDDGVRLWVNNQLIIDKWFDQAGPEWSSAPISLVSGVKYDIKVEYYENTLGAQIYVKWSSPSTAKQTIPQSQLFPPACSYSISPSSQSFAASGGTGTVNVSTAPGCGWTATSTAWITITSGGSGTGPGSVSYSVLSNPSPNPRNGTITIVDQTFNVSQDGIGSCAGPANGTGLKGDYFNNKFLTGAPVLTRTDPVVDFQWGTTGSPDSGIPNNQFSARWTGQVQAQCSEAYTFYAFSDDGVRLWVNNQLIIEKWFDQTGPELASTAISLVAGVKYDIKVEYYENTGGAQIYVKWSSPSTAKQTIPQSQLFPACSYSISPTSQSFAASGGTGSVSVTAGTGCTWQAVSNSGFLTITSAANGTGNGTVTYSVASNPNTTPQTGTMTIAGQTFTVNQAGACSYTLNPTSMAFSANGGTSAVSVTAPAGCGWSATGSPGWITITSGSTGTGNGTVNYTVSTNTAGPRNGTITINGGVAVLNVFQSGASCTSWIPPNQSFGAAGGTGTITVAWASGTGCSWTAVSNNAWITITSGSSGVDGGTVTFSVAPNTGPAQVGSITVAGNTVTINQAAGGATNTSLWLTGTAYVNVPAPAGSGLDLTGSFTVEAWVKTSNTSANQGVIERWNPSDGGVGFNGGYALRILRNPNQLRFSVFRNSADGRDLFSDSTSPVPNDGQWHHLAGVYDATTSPSKLRVYIDGHLRGTKSLTTFTVPSGNGNLTIGAAADGTQKLTGLIEDARVTAAVLYNADFVRPYPLSVLTGTRALWRFDNNYADSAGTNTGTITGTGATFSTDLPPPGGMGMSTPEGRSALEALLAINNPTPPRPGMPEALIETGSEAVRPPEPATDIYATEKTPITAGLSGHQSGEDRRRRSPDSGGLILFGCAAAAVLFRVRHGNSR